MGRLKADVITRTKSGLALSIVGKTRLSRVGARNEIWLIEINKTTI